MYLAPPWIRQCHVLKQILTDNHFFERPVRIVQTSVRFNVGHASVNHLPAVQCGWVGGTRASGIKVQCGEAAFILHLRKTHYTAQNRRVYSSFSVFIFCFAQIPLISSLHNHHG